MAQTQNDKPRIVAGCMTGTSLDGLDVALVRIDGRGLDMKATLLGHHAVPLPGDLRETLMHLASGNPAEPIVFLRAARQLGQFHAEVLGELFAKHPDAKPDFITAHGQTIWHAPKDSADLGPMSWQLFDPWPIVQRHGVPVCYDLRQADLIAGGEGAPLTPIADWVMYRDSRVARYVVNLGGVANYTALTPGSPAELINAQDYIGCNLVIDGIVRHYWGNMRYDIDGLLAAAGKSHGVLLEPILAPLVAAHERFFEGDRFSLGREDYSEVWLHAAIDRHCHGMIGEDVLASAIDAISSLIASLVEDYYRDEVVLAGGGARNPVLVSAIASKVATCNSRVLLSDDLGIPCEAREAMGWAVLGALSQDGVPVSLPQVTGATRPGVAGVWAGR